MLAAELARRDDRGRSRRLRQRVIAFRRRYVQVETALDFYGDAINSRTSRDWPGCCARATCSRSRASRRCSMPLRQEVPPVLTFVDKGLGAIILRAGLRLVDGGPLTRRGRSQDHAPEPLPAHGADPRDRAPGRRTSSAGTRSSRRLSHASSRRIAELAATSGAPGAVRDRGRHATRFAYTGYGSVAGAARRRLRGRVRVPAHARRSASRAVPRVLLVVQWRPLLRRRALGRSRAGVDARVPARLRRRRRRGRSSSSRCRSCRGSRSSACSRRCARSAAGRSRRSSTRCGCDRTRSRRLARESGAR